MNTINNRQIAWLLAIVGIGVLAVRAVSNRKQQVMQTLPPPVQQGGTTAQWQQWVALALQVYGSVSALWQPGGPFYNQNPQDVYNSVPSSVHQQWDWNDPNAIPTGLA